MIRNLIALMMFSWCPTINAEAFFVIYTIANYYHKTKPFIGARKIKHEFLDDQMLMNKYSHIHTQSNDYVLTKLYTYA